MQQVRRAHAPAPALLDAKLCAGGRSPARPRWSTGGGLVAEKGAPGPTRHDYHAPIEVRAAPTPAPRRSRALPPGRALLRRRTARWRPSRANFRTGEEVPSPHAPRAPARPQNGRDQNFILSAPLPPSQAAWALELLQGVRSSHRFTAPSACHAAPRAVIRLAVCGSRNGRWHI